MDTTATTLQWITIALALYPEVQETCQKEMDHVVGRDRMPNIDDQPKLEYLYATIKEVMRLYPVAALG